MITSVQSQAQSVCVPRMCCSRPLPCWTCTSSSFRLIVRRAKKNVNVFNCPSVLERLVNNFFSRDSIQYGDYRAFIKFIDWMFFHFRLSASIDGRTVNVLKNSARSKLLC